MYLPYSKSIHYEKSLEAQLEEINGLIEREPTQSRFYEMKADTLVKLGEDKQALVWYNRAIELAVPNASRYCRKGDVLARLDRAGEAMECYEKAISLTDREHLLFGCCRCSLPFFLQTQPIQRGLDGVYSYAYQQGSNGLLLADISHLDDHCSASHTLYFLSVAE